MENSRNKIKTNRKPHREVSQCFNPVIFQSCANEKLVSKKKTARLPRANQWKRSEKQRLPRRRGHACGHTAIWIKFFLWRILYANILWCTGLALITVASRFTNSELYCAIINRSWENILVPLYSLLETIKVFQIANKTYVAAGVGFKFESRERAWAVEAQSGGNTQTSCRLWHARGCAGTGPCQP